MKVIRWVVGGTIGGAIGVALWVLVGWLSQYEVAWIAWGVGFLVGVGVRYAAFGEASPGQGVTAAVVAFVGIFAAKFLVFTLLVGGSDAEALREAADSIRLDQEALVATEAYDVCLEMKSRGKTIDWPPGKSIDNASRRDDYPPRLWRIAEDRWKRMSPQQREARKHALAAAAEVLSTAAEPPGFGEFFSLWDFLWFGLAIVTAGTIGAGTYGLED